MSIKIKYNVGDRVLYKDAYLATIVGVNFKMVADPVMAFENGKPIYNVSSFDIILDIDGNTVSEVDGDKLSFPSEKDLKTKRNSDKIIFVMSENRIRGAYIEGDVYIKDVETDYKPGDLKGTLHKALNALLDAGFKQTALIKWPEAIDIFNKETSNHISNVLASMTEEQKNVVDLLMSSALLHRNKKKED